MSSLIVVIVVNIIVLNIIVLNSNIRKNGTLVKAKSLSFAFIEISAILCTKVVKKKKKKKENSHHSA